MLIFQFIYLFFFSKLFFLAEAEPGGLAYLKRNGRFIYYLVTKPRYYKKPTMNSLKHSILEMKQHCVQNGVKYLAMPQIGCGLDKLKWNEVRSMLCSIFRHTDIQIVVYSL